MFHKLILLSDGKIAYHGVPQKAYGFFVEAAVNSFLNKKLAIPEIGEHNPAGKSSHAGRKHYYCKFLSLNLNDDLINFAMFTVLKVHMPSGHAHVNDYSN